MNFLKVKIYISHLSNISKNIKVKILTAKIDSIAQLSS